MIPNNILDSCMHVLQWVWEQRDIDWFGNSHQRSWLSERTVEAMCNYICGTTDCEHCRATGGTPSGRVEGHHHATKMFISDYRHNKTQKARREAMRRLARELSDSVVLLCKRCHETAHHDEGW